MTRRTFGRGASAVLVIATAGRKAAAQTRETRTRELNQVAQSVFAAKGLSISPRCRGWLEEFIAGGVERLERDGAGASGMQEARTNIGKFANLMIQNRMAGGTVIDDEAFQRAKNGCHFYPFCG